MTLLIFSLTYRLLFLICTPFLSVLRIPQCPFLDGPIHTIWFVLSQRFRVEADTSNISERAAFVILGFMFTISNNPEVHDPLSRRRRVRAWLLRLARCSRWKSPGGFKWFLCNLTLYFFIWSYKKWQPALKVKLSLFFGCKLMIFSLQTKCFRIFPRISLTILSSVIRLSVLLPLHSDYRIVLKGISLWPFISIMVVSL